MVAKGDGPRLLGCDWLSRLHLDWKILALHTHQSLDSILEFHGAIFKPELGTLWGVEAKLDVEAAQAQPEEVVSTTAPQHLEAPISLPPTVAGQ